MGLISKAKFLLRRAMLPKQSNPVARAAVAGLRAKWSPRGPHQCQVFARKCYEQVFGNDFSEIDLGTATLTAISFRQHGYSVPLKHGSRPGDLLYKITGSGGDGHVGIRVAGNMVAENSSVHWDGSDARGLRTLEEFGNFDIIVRLHETDKKAGAK
jgi:hypothetical protein